MTLKPAFVEKAKPFMVADCHLVRCRFPECVGHSNICNTRAEAYALSLRSPSPDQAEPGETP